MKVIITELPLGDNLGSLWRVARAGKYCGTWLEAETLEHFDSLEVALQFTVDMTLDVVDVDREELKTGGKRLGC